MTMQTKAVPRPITQQGFARAGWRQAQHGVVLIIAMVLLVVISLLGVTSLRNAGSTENVAGHVRTTELARQAADIALRHCESSVLAIERGAPDYITTFLASDILPPSEPLAWRDMSAETGWDSASTATYILPLDLVNDVGMAFRVYRRPPECRVEQLAAVTTTNATFYVITARGFGPEVAPADARRQAPDGSEVWLQSHIELR